MGSLSSQPSPSESSPVKELSLLRELGCSLQQRNPALSLSPPPLHEKHYGQWASPKISVLCCKIVLQLFASTKYVNRFFFLIPLRPEILPKALKLAKLQEPLLLSDGKRKWLRIVHSLTNDGNDDIIFTFCFELEDDIVSETARRHRQRISAFSSRAREILS